MEYPKGVWVPLGPVRNGAEDDVDTPRTSNVWITPQGQLEGVDSNPEAYNRTRVDSFSGPQGRSNSPDAPDATIVPTSNDPSISPIRSLALENQPAAEGNSTTASSDEAFSIEVPPNDAPANRYSANEDPSSAGYIDTDRMIATSVGPDNANSQVILAHGAQTYNTAPNTHNQVIPYGARAWANAHNQAGTFRPMRATTQPIQPAVPLYLPQQAGHNTALVPYGAMVRVAAGFSPNYQGNTNLDANRSADIPEDHNCSLFVTGLPPNVTVTTLLRGIRNAGRIYAVHINSPEPARGHFTCAAKVTFFDRPSAERLFWYSLNGLQLPDYPGYFARVVWNRIRTAAVLMPHFHSRVLLVTGPSDIVTSLGLYNFFTSKFVFEVDEVFDLGSNGYQSFVEFRFGSYRCQAEAGKMALERELGHVVRVRYGHDPCE